MGEADSGGYEQVLPRRMDAPGGPAPGSKVTKAPEKGAESFPGNSRSTRTSPVKYSAVPLTEGREPARVMGCDILSASAIGA